MSTRGPRGWAPDQPDGSSGLILRATSRNSSADLPVCAATQQATGAAREVAGNDIAVVAQVTIDDDGNCLYSSVSADGGKTWGDFVKIPDDSTDGASFQTEAAASSAAAAAVWSPNTSNGSDQCGRPELSRSLDQHTWTSCLFDKGKTFSVSTDAYGAAFASDGTLWLVFQNASQGEAPALGAGVWLVRQAA